MIFGVFSVDYLFALPSFRVKNRYLAKDVDKTMFVFQFPSAHDDHFFVADRGHNGVISWRDDVLLNLNLLPVIFIVGN